MIEDGKTVKIHYTGTLDDGTQFDSSAGREPLEFEMGAGMVIPGFEKGVAGMAVGDKKTIHIPAAEAYGERREDLVMQFERSQLPEDLSPEVGMGLQMQGPQGQPVPVTVASNSASRSKAPVRSSSATARSARSSSVSAEARPTYALIGSTTSASTPWNA